MANVDVICIGAINYDYMFHCKKEDLIVNEGKDGDENLSNPISDVENDIFELVCKGNNYTTQIGGSAFITLKVVKSIQPELRVAYVGVCGTPNEFDMKYGKSNNIDLELSHLDDREWLFTTRERFEEPYYKAIAKSVVRLHNHSRNCIKIAPCANNTLLNRIKEHEHRTEKSFAEYLASAKWIHLSSLSDFTQFEAIMFYVIEAKKINPELKISMDPGFEYTSVWRERLQGVICYVDYVFLNKSEKNNLGLHAEDVTTLYQNLCNYFTEYDITPNRTLIVKYEDKHELLSFENGKSKIRTVRHTKLSNYQMNNDTGAGDSFAGGFIRGMLDDRINGDIAGPIALGVRAAKGRMISFDYEDPYMKIQTLTKEFFENMDS